MTGTPIYGTQPFVGSKPLGTFTNAGAKAKVVANTVFFSEPQLDPGYQYITRLLDIMQSGKELPPLPKDILKPIIVTGIDALGRGHDLNKYKTFMTVLKELGPEVVAKYINMGDLITRIGTATMIDMAGLVKSEQDLAAEMQQAQQMQMQSKIMDMAKAAAPQAVKGVADMANAQMQPPQAAQDSGAPAPGSPPSP